MMLGIYIEALCSCAPCESNMHANVIQKEHTRIRSAVEDL
jgi:hypothetical protein